VRFGDKLRWLIDENGLTQKLLAEKLHIPASTLTNYVNNLREPDYDTLKLIANHFNVSVDYLLDNHPQKGEKQMEDALLRAFGQLSPEHQRVCLELTKAAVQVLGREK